MSEQEEHHVDEVPVEVVIDTLDKTERGTARKSVRKDIDFWAELFDQT